MGFPADRINRDDFALLVIDPQERLAAAMSRREPVLAATVKLIRLAGLVQAPVIATRQYPKGLGDFEPVVASALDELTGAETSVEVVDKLSFCACGEPAFVEALADSGRRQIVVAGMETHICVTQTTLDLLDRGLSVHVAADACCSRDSEAHGIALDRMRAAGAVVTMTESVMYEAVPEAGTDKFRELLAIVKG
ncbi:MAG: isochorismatase family protein [Coriobacteriales bacterium]|nr:isochorismatase family protein [Coriobacteriales bacterium]